jgi:ABC-type multidrug transport system ATPase subunit
MPNPLAKSASMLGFENLSKRYDERVIFQRLRYSANARCVVLNDESGSGKSTLLGILAGEVEPDQGEVWIDGHSSHHDTPEAKILIAYTYSVGAGEWRWEGSGPEAAEAPVHDA